LATKAKEWNAQSEAAILQKQHRRKDIILELLNTERQYATDLSTLINVYVRPIQRRGLMNREEIISVFSNIEGIYTLTQALFQACGPKHIRVMMVVVVVVTVTCDEQISLIDARY
jgi:hypothetical protein